MKKYFIVIILIFLLAVAGLFLGKNNQSKIKKIYFKDKLLTVEVADTPSLRTQGLSGRKEMAQDHGMLFIFEKEEVYSFWMKDMHFPLDFIWIRDDVVADISKNVPVPETDDERFLPTYTSSVPVDKVLEINAGIANELGIKVGDKVTFNI